MRVFHLIFRSRTSALAAAAVVVLLGASAYQVRHAFITLGAPSSYVAPDAPDTAVATGDASFQQELMLLGLATTSDPSASSDTDPSAMIGPVVVAQLIGQYAGLVETGTYTPEKGATAAGSIAPYVRAAISYKTYNAADIRTDVDTSYERMLRYRADLRDALAPLLQNTQQEFELYAKYVETSDPSYLDELSAAALNYRAAASNTASLVVPRDALNYHLDILNAMALFAATIEEMSDETADPFASAALLRSYNTAEQKMFVSFDSLSNYYGQKLP